MQIAKVIIERPVEALDLPFDYYVPSGMQALEGVRVQVEFNKKLLVGYIESLIDVNENLEQYEQKVGFKLNPILHLIDHQRIIDDELKQLAHFLASTTLAPLISCYQALLPPALKPTSGEKTKIKYEKWIRVINEDTNNLTEKQTKALEYFIKNKTIKAADAMIHSGIVNRLIALHRIEKYDKETYRSLYELPYVKIEDYSITSAQKQAIETFLHSPKQIALLEGVTGSGKTEVYIHLAKHYLDRGQNVLILVPEISLTPVMVKRFKERFDVSIAVLHSGLSHGEKYDEYRRISRGEVRLVIGARSAIFAPLKSIGLIVIDEEHSETYKQDNKPSYHVLNVAIERARVHQCKIILGSATPSLETKARAQKGVYEYLTLPARINQRVLPEVTLVDMTNENKNHNYSPFSRLLIQEIQTTLDRQEQVILLLNRRGYSPSVNCRKCGYTFQCPKCAISLIYHKSDETLKCHYCGHQEKYPSVCPACGSSYIRNIGTGTQRIEIELNKQFPNSRVVRMDLDTTIKKDNHIKMIQDFDERKYDILLGTQMISKGFDFPNVTLVGVINADVGLYNGDFRNNERTFQLLTQVVGRSGRSHLTGKAIIQTYNPNNYAIQLAAKQDFTTFYQQEMQHRKEASYPPYTYLAMLLFQGKKIDDVDQVANYIKKTLQAMNDKDIVLGPAVPYVAQLNNKFRFRILVKTKNINALMANLQEIKKIMMNYPGIELQIDTSPYQSL